MRSSGVDKNNTPCESQIYKDFTCLRSCHYQDYKLHFSEPIESLKYKRRPKCEASNFIGGKKSFHEPVVSESCSVSF